MSNGDKGKPPTQNEFLTLLDELEGIQASYETCAGAAQAGGKEELIRIDNERDACRKKLLAMFAAAQEATYPSEAPPSAIGAPSGWKLVPIRGTPNMLVAGANVEPPCAVGDVIARWAAMMAAAPMAPTDGGANSG